MEERERLELVRFVEDTERLLRWVIHDPHSAVPKYLRRPLIDAWPTTRSRFASLRGSVDAGELDDRLDEHGLSGPELIAKLIAFRAPYEAWERRSRRRARSNTEENWRPEGETA
jgi:hypothetical protein